MNRIALILTAAIFALSLLEARPAMASINIGIGISIGTPPPPIPYYAYEQPPPPAPNWIWIPGYWRWDGEDGGYHWMRGRWTPAPEPGLYWTPGYWAWNGDGYYWNGGYWGRTVGYYGDVNYGCGYYGRGYDGGEWDGDRFRYNSYVTHVDRNTIGNAVYYDPHVIRRAPQEGRQSYVQVTHAAAPQNARGNARDQGHQPGYQSQRRQPQPRYQPQRRQPQPRGNQGGGNQPRGNRGGGHQQRGHGHDNGGHGHGRPPA